MQSVRRERLKDARLAFIVVMVAFLMGIVVGKVSAEEINCNHQWGKCIGLISDKRAEKCSFHNVQPTGWFNGAGTQYQCLTCKVYYCGSSEHKFSCSICNSLSKNESVLWEDCMRNYNCDKYLEKYGTYWEKDKK